MPNFDYHALAPESILTGIALIVLLVDLFLPRQWKWLTATLAGAGVLAALVPVLTLWVTPGPRELFGGSFVVDRFSLVLKALFLGSSFITLLLAFRYIEDGSYKEGEFYFLLLSSVLGMLVISSARDLITLFIAIELVSSPTYLLAGWRKTDPNSIEGALKYFLIGVLSIAVSLYGMSLIFGITGGSLRFQTISSFFASGPPHDVAVLGAVAVVLVLVGFAFKISAVPFHFWAPDAYQGAPTPVTAFLSVASKAAGFVGIYSLILVAFPAQVNVWRPVIYGLAVATMTVGNLIALRQTNVVRLLAYSSIAHAGYILAPLAAIGSDGRISGSSLSASISYLFVYAVMNLGAFGAVIAIAQTTKSAEVSTWTGLVKRAPWLTLTTVFFLFSLAGVPPAAGIWAKFLVFRAIVKAGGGTNLALAAIVALNSVIAVFYYANVAKKMIFDSASSELDATENVPVPSTVASALGILAGITLLWFILPNFVFHLGATGVFQ
ncbi:MAG: NADH-quinone oxidoreductase subunit N [Acidimicrobiia bacterium]